MYVCLSSVGYCILEDILNVCAPVFPGEKPALLWKGKARISFSFHFQLWSLVSSEALIEQQRGQSFQILLCRRVGEVGNILSLLIARKE